MERGNLFFDELDFKASPDLCRNPKCLEDREELFERRAERRFALQVYLCFLCHFENKYRGAMRRHFRETHGMMMVEVAPNKTRDAGRLVERELKGSVKSDDIAARESGFSANTLKNTTLDEDASDEALKKINIIQIKLKNDRSKREDYNEVDNIKERVESSMNDAKQDDLKDPHGTHAINDLGKITILATENIQTEDVLLAEDRIRGDIFDSSAETATEPSEEDELHPMNYESTDLTQRNEYEKILFEGRIFHSYDEFLNAIKMYEEASNFILCNRSTVRCKDSNLDQNKFPKKRSRFVCQAGQRERHMFKAGFRQRRKSDKLIEKTGCPVGLSINLQDTDQHGIGYVVTKFNHSDHNHLPRKK